MTEVKWFLAGKFLGYPRWVLREVINNHVMPEGVAQVLHSSSDWLADVWGVDDGTKFFDNIEDAKIWAQTVYRMKQNKNS